MCDSVCLLYLLLTYAGHATRPISARRRRGEGEGEVDLAVRGKARHRAVTAPPLLIVPLVLGPRLRGVDRLLEAPVARRALPMAHEARGGRGGQSPAEQARRVRAELLRVRGRGRGRVRVRVRVRGRVRVRVSAFLTFSEP